MDQQALIRQNRQFFDLHLLLHCFLKEGEFARNLAEPHGAGIDMEFECCGGVKNVLRLTRDTVCLLLHKQVSAGCLAYHSGHGRSDPLCESWTFLVKECGVEITLKIVEYRLWDGKQHSVIKNPKDKSVGDEQMLGRVVVLAAKTLNAVSV